MYVLYLPTASTLKGYQCTVCKIELNSVEQYQSHISGAKHKNQYVAPATLCVSRAKCVGLIFFFVVPVFPE